MASSESESADTLRSTSLSPSPIRALHALGRPKKNPVWDFFSYQSDKNASLCKVAACRGDGPGSSKVCDHSIPGKFPTDLKNHLKRLHPSEYAEVLRKEENAKQERSEAKTNSLSCQKQLTLRESIDGKYRWMYDKSSVQYKNITKKLAVSVWKQQHSQ